MRGSSGPRGCPFTHMLALKGQTEKSGAKGQVPSTLNAVRLLSQVYPQKTLWGGGKNSLCCSILVPASCHCHSRILLLQLAQTG